MAVSKMKNKPANRNPVKKGGASGSGTLRMQKDQEWSPLLDKEWYKMKFTEHEIRQGNFGDYILLKFKILSGFDEEGKEATGRIASGMLNAILSPKSPLYRLVKACNGGKELDIDDEVDLSAFYGKIIKGFVENKKKRDKEGRISQNVVDFRAIPKKK